MGLIILEFCYQGGSLEDSFHDLQVLNRDKGEETL